MKSKRMVVAMIVAGLSAIAAADLRTQPSFPADEIDLSTPTAAAVTHWRTRMVSDPGVNRAQYYATNPLESRALEIWLENMAASVEFNRAAIQRFGEDAVRGKDGILAADTSRTTYESVKWLMDGDVATPVNPPPEIAEREMVRVNGKWLQPVSVWINSDQRRLSQVTKQTAFTRALTVETNSGKYKDLPRLKAAWEKTPSLEAGMMLTPPAFLPDNNPTIPSGALAALATAIVSKDLKGVRDRFVSANDGERAFTEVIIDWINADVDLVNAIEKKFGRAASDRYLATCGFNTPTLIAYALLRGMDQADTHIVPNPQRAQVGVPSALLWDLRKSGDRWQISARDSVAELSQINAIANVPPALPDGAVASFRQAAKDEREIAHDINAGRITEIENIRDELERRTESAHEKSTTRGS